jgi:cobaltochelatase CobS
MKKTTVSYGKIKLPINEIKNEYIPVTQKIIGYKNILKTLAFSVDKNLPALLIGETGLGKTALVRHLAYETNNGFRRLNLNGQTTVDEFVGRTLLNKEGTYWQDGVLTDALRNGYWLLLDEINAALPEILFVLHSLLDDDRFIVIPENGGEIVKPHPNFRIFATMNPSGKYHGTKDLNKAFLSRFPIIVQLDYPKPEEEQLIIQSYSKISNSNAKNLCLMAKDIRSSYFKDEIDTVCSTRDLINCAIMSEDIGIKESLVLAVINRAGKEDTKAISTIVRLYFGSTDLTTEDEFSLTKLADIAQNEMLQLDVLIETLKRRNSDLITYIDGISVDNDSLKKHFEKTHELITDFIKNKEAGTKMIERYYQGTKGKS